MSPEYMKAAIVGTWVLAWGIMASSVNVSSASSWMLVVGAGLLPPLMFVRMWRQPAPARAASIRPGPRS